MTDAEAAIVILMEVTRARAKFPAWPTDQIHAAGILVEEAGETMQAALQAQYELGAVSQIDTEAIHAGAMAVRLLTRR